MPRNPISRLLTENVQPRAGRGGWHGGPTPLGAVRGVRARQARWAPARGRKSVWQLTLHAAYWKYAVRRLLESALDTDSSDATSRFPRSPSNWPTVPATAGEREWRADVALLRDEHQRLIEVIAQVPVARYGRKPPRGKRWTLGELIVGIAQHDAYHAGQIQMLKRLYDVAR
jgi:DinB family protein